MIDLAAINEAIAPKRDALIAETLHFCGGGYMVADESIPPPTVGVVALMDALSLPWIEGGREASDDDIRAALVLLQNRENAVGLVMEAILTDAPIESMAACYLTEIGGDELRLAGRAIGRMLEVAATGFNFFPKTGDGSGGALTFDAEFLGGVCRVYGDLGVPPERALWREPLARTGFLMATAARYNGAKNIGRENSLDWNEAWRKAKGE